MSNSSTYLSHLENVVELLDSGSHENLTSDQRKLIFDVSHGVIGRLLTAMNSILSALDTVETSILHEHITRGRLMAEQIQLLAYIAADYVSDEALAIKKERENECH